jgi:UDP-glucose 4-epimerase
MTKVLVTGSSGYIGSHTAIDLLEHGYEVIGLDNQSNSSDRSYERVKAITHKSIKPYYADLRNKDEVRKVFEENKDIRCVIHFAALKSVDESVQQPMLYFENNISGMINLLSLQQEYSIPYHIFSSSCTVYGNTHELPVTEKTPWNTAESPYGLTKQIGEQILENLVKLLPDMSGISLRYFNPAGAHPSGLLGEAAIKEVRNLIPLIMEVGYGKRDHLNVFGNDYPTRDGTNIRDYIHIMDLAHAHTLALKYLESHPPDPTLGVYNLGAGEGVSILETIRAFDRVTGKTLNYKLVDRRPGDVVAIYADYSKAKQELGWQPRYSLDDIIRDAWNWEKNKSAFLSL